jgi:Nif-specific regulatory protein
MALPSSAAMPMRSYSWVREDEAQDLLEALRRAGGNKTRAAMLLGMTPRQFRYRMVKLGLGEGG